MFSTGLLQFTARYTYVSITHSLCMSRFAAPIACSAPMHLMWYYVHYETNNLKTPFSSTYTMYHIHPTFSSTNTLQHGHFIQHPLHIVAYPHVHLTYQQLHQVAIPMHTSFSRTYNICHCTPLMQHIHIYTSDHQPTPCGTPFYISFCNNYVAHSMYTCSTLHVHIMQLHLHQATRPLYTSVSSTHIMWHANSTSHLAVPTSCSMCTLYLTQQYRHHVACPLCISLSSTYIMQHAHSVSHLAVPTSCSMPTLHLTQQYLHHVARPLCISLSSTYTMQHAHSAPSQQYLHHVTCPLCTSVSGTYIM